MSRHSSARPRRSHVFPFALVASALLWFVNRDAGISGTSFQTFAFGVASVAVGYLVAVLVVAAVNPDSDAESASGLRRTLFFPSNETLAVFAVISLALGGYAVFGSLVALPGGLDSIVRLLGLVLGWPLVAVSVATIAVGNAFGEFSFAVEAVAVGVGVACSTAWIFLLSGWLADTLGRVSSTAETVR